MKSWEERTQELADLMQKLYPVTDSSSDIKRLQEEWQKENGIRQVQEALGKAGVVGIPGGRGLSTKDDLDSMIIRLPQGIGIDSSVDLNDPLGQKKWQHVHEYVEYKGLVEQYEYCKSCNERK